jgi:hypothetical protein
MHLNIAFYKRAFSRSSSIYRVFTTRKTWAFSFLVLHPNIAFLETYGLLEAFLYKHLLVA